ncbi:MAG: leucine-rich repeat domain-containing protein, partial [Mobilitalea sp.]
MKPIKGMLFIIFCMIFTGCGSREEMKTKAVAPGANAPSLEESDNSTQEEAVTSSEGFSYEIIDNKVKITGCDESVGTKIVIPSKIDGYEVAVIGDHAFARNPKLISVELPDTVTEIEDYAFGWCDDLEEVILSESITRIGEGAFICNYALSEVIIPEGVTSIEKATFSVCSDLKSVYIPNSVTNIGDDAFSSCINLGDVTLSINVTSIADNAFEDCKNLALYTVLGSYADEY